MCPHVRLEMGALCVRFPASRELAVVRGGTFSGPRPAASLLLNAALLVRVQLQQGWRGRRGEHHPLHGHRMVALVRVVLSLELWQTPVLRGVWRTEILVWLMGTVVGGVDWC